MDLCVGEPQLCIYISVQHEGSLEGQKIRCLCGNVLKCKIEQNAIMGRKYLYDIE